MKLIDSTAFVLLGEKYILNNRYIVVFHINRIVICEGVEAHKWDLCMGKRGKIYFRYREGEKNILDKKTHFWYGQNLGTVS